MDITLKGPDSLDEADFARRPIKFMYSDATHLHFLDRPITTSIRSPRTTWPTRCNYLTEELEGVQALIYNEECVGIQLPVTVELKVTQCDPAVRGNSATGRTKPATLQTGLVVHVPEYLTEGEVVKVDTRNGQYLSRA